MIYGTRPCGSCNREIAVDAKWCPHCGQRKDLNEKSKLIEKYRREGCDYVIAQPDVTVDKKKDPSRCDQYPSVLK